MTDIVEVVKAALASRGGQAGGPIEPLRTADIAALVDEIERLRGLSADADLRLRAAGFRVGVYAGSDTPEYLADEIERLRDRVNALLSERLA